MSGPIAQYEAILDQLVAKARNAAERNKPTMWAYYLDAAEGLMDWFFDVERTDGAYAGAALALSEHAAKACPNLNAPEAARLWARGVYARQILRGWDVPAPRVSLDWLRKRAGAGMTLGVPRERPTAAQPGVSGAAGLVRAPALVGGRASAVPEGRRSLSEVALEHAYAGPLRVERCLCGGSIVAAANDWPAIALEVRAHGLSTGHQQWMNAAGWR